MIETNLDQNFNSDAVDEVDEIKSGEKQETSHEHDHSYSGSEDDNPSAPVCYTQHPPPPPKQGNVAQDTAFA